ncbi:eukaryotic translation elongation factor 1 delta b (guanine nucleotide exchange protein) isoform X1 [Epinephelus moara]|uniref:eukaryotic translation elongation factor 1 delta b (guanine nucleotide exchange protein) isoform X1 n=2 Tax=Epinephelus moara TaxID=300413 RepID=UPI00214E1F5B|nr:eukaryotic translation elongation factor 1 delta b (guanine nucleotide exchange protein) isoform X1 [Epinephelus moara]XP_049910180.1 eukaryotic translation elongation factor 1 delta b (guanine nucleotide exchange protein) isoform X1 [Epinephelus moara]
MMSKKIPQCPALDQSEHDQPSSHCQVDQSANAALGCRNKAESSQRNREAASSSPESGSLNGDGKRTGKSRRRKKRSSNPESRPEGKVDSKTKNEEKPDKRTSQPPDPRAGLIGLQSECANVWFERSIYERAESLYQCWLASSSNGTTKSNRSPPAPGKHSNSPSNVAPTSSGLVCHHSDQVACHHVVQAVWVNKTSFDQAERRYVEESMQLPIPNSLDLPSPPNRSIVPRTPDEGYQSLAPTPATPVIQQAAVTPTNRQSINGLPRIPVELLRDVWLEKPLYDRAEAAFYQNLYGNNSSKRSSCTSTSRSSDHPQSLVEEEEEEEVEEVVVEEKRVVPQGKAEVFHALLPIQEEEEPAEVPEREEMSEAGVCYFNHPDSERVWLDKWRYDAAESRFHGYSGSEAVAVKKGRRPEAASVASTTPLRDNTMSSVDFLAQEKIWFDKPRYDEAERRFYERMNGSSQQTQDVGANTILQDIARARENIQKSLAGMKNSLCNRGSCQPSLSQQSRLSSTSAADQGEIVSRIKSLELENQSLHKVVDDLRAALSKLECRVSVLEKQPAAVTPAPAPSVPYTNGTTIQQKTSAPVKDEEEEDEDDDIDLFGSDEDDEEAEKIKEQRLKEYAEKKAKKPGIIAKSSILLDVKPWDDETDMAELEECVRSVQADGLLWGTSKLVPVGYGIKKLQIACVVEDDKVGTDMLEEEITKFEDYVQSVDVAAFNKI